MRGNPMSEIITLDSILLGALSLLLSFAIWAGHRYISRDDAWKQAHDRKMADIIAVRSVCIQGFAAKKDVNELFKVARNHGERIAKLEGTAGK